MVLGNSITDSVSDLIHNSICIKSRIKVNDSIEGESLDLVWDLLRFPIIAVRDSVYNRVIFSTVWK